MRTDRGIAEPAPTSRVNNPRGVLLHQGRIPGADGCYSRRTIGLKFRTAGQLNRSGNELSAAGRITRAVLKHDRLGRKVHRAGEVHGCAAAEVVAVCRRSFAVAEENDPRGGAACRRS